LLPKRRNAESAVNQKVLDPSPTASVREPPEGRMSPRQSVSLRSSVVPVAKGTNRERAQVVAVRVAAPSAPGAVCSARRRRLAW
jgi:hypothetical protein